MKQVNFSQKSQNYFLKFFSKLITKIPYFLFFKLAPNWNWKLLQTFKSFFRPGKLYEIFLPKLALDWTRNTKLVIWGTHWELLAHCRHKKHQNNDQLYWCRYCLLISTCQQDANLEISVSSNWLNIRSKFWIHP